MEKKQPKELIQIKIVRADITTLKVNAIVNSANPNYTVGPGIDSAICRKSGFEKILKTRMQNGKYNMLPTDTFISEGYELAASHIIHVCGPKPDADYEVKKEILGRCYSACLNKAVEENYKSVAMPMIGSGHLHVNINDSFDIALKECERFKEINEPKGVKLEINLVVMGDGICKHIRSKKLDFEELIDSEKEKVILHEAEEAVKGNLPVYRDWEDMMYESVQQGSENANNSKGGAKADKKAFLDKLHKFYHEKRKEKKYQTQKAVAEKCGLSPGGFSHIYRGENVRIPARDSVISICFGLELDLNQAIQLMMSAGYSFNSDPRDQIISVGIREKKDFYDVEDELIEKGFKPLSEELKKEKKKDRER